MIYVVLCIGEPRSWGQVECGDDDRMRRQGRFACEGGAKAEGRKFADLGLPVREINGYKTIESGMWQKGNGFGASWSVCWSTALRQFDRFRGCTGPLLLERFHPNNLLSCDQSS